MKKYTNKILITTAVLLLTVFTIQFFIQAEKTKKQIKQSQPWNQTINH